MMYSFSASTLILAAMVAPALAAPIDNDSHAPELQRSLVGSAGKSFGKKLPGIFKSTAGQAAKAGGQGVIDGVVTAALNGFGSQPTETVVVTAAASGTAAPNARREPLGPLFQGLGPHPFGLGPAEAPPLSLPSSSPTATSDPRTRILSEIPTHPSSSPTAPSAPLPTEPPINQLGPDIPKLFLPDASHERRGILSPLISLGEDGLKEVLPKILEGFGDQSAETSQANPSTKGAKTSRRELDARKSSSFGNALKNGLKHAATHDVPNAVGQAFGNEAASLAFGQPAVTTIIQAPAPAQPTQAQRRSEYEQRSVVTEIEPILKSIFENVVGGTSSPAPKPLEGTQSASRRSLNEDQIAVLKALVSRAIDELD